MADFTGKVVVITGAAHGLGKAMAEVYADLGARLALCDIDSDGLDEVREVLEKRGVEVATGMVDVTQASQFEEFKDQVYEMFGCVDILVNNAGAMLAGRMKDMTLEDWQWVVGINMWGVIHGTHFFFPEMVKRGSGHIVNIASAGGLMPLPLLSAYSGTKSAVVTMTRVWRAEGAKHGVGFTAICPSIMNTNVSKSFRIRTGTDRKPVSDSTSEKANRFLAGRRFDPANVARIVVRAVVKNKSVVPVGFEAHLIDLTNRFSRRLVDFLIERLARLSERWT